ncbi:MAG TPA: helix-turn-helix domain-containing protein [Planctomycetes bacterium]|jgi:XRE family aerobic/anaerobic benzoate catabolism transcriptional regulator|nr:helix-turn-helix domain-containing protein [Planctomycetota bacterium]
MAFDSTHLLKLLGKRVRRLRMQQNRSLQHLSQEASLSRRFLVEIEAGRANPSVSKLAALSHSLGIALGSLCDLPVHTIPYNRICLLGIRGAGKSTLGPKLAAQIGVGFQELDNAIENKAGMPTREIFEIEGRDGFLKREADAVEDWLRENDSGVLALPGSIVNHGIAYERLLSTCTTVWLSASADAHFERVVAQGDTRPLEGGHSNAMKHLAGLLKDRTASYDRADLTVDTSTTSIEHCLQQITTFLNDRQHADH